MVCQCLIKGTTYGYSDSDGGGDDVKKSTAGYIFMIGDAPIAWSSKKHDIVALSSCFHRICCSFYAALWIEMLLGELNAFEVDRMSITSRKLIWQITDNI